MPKRPRLTPYTAAGIVRIPCARCGKPSRFQWNVCADNVNGRPQFRGLCVDCDIALNRLAMRFVFGRTRDADITAYAKAARADA
jgi:hypothetical protein